MYVNIVSIFMTMRIDVLIVSLLHIFRMIQGMMTMFLLHLFHFITLWILGERKDIEENYLLGRV